MSDWHRDESKLKAYEAGISARAMGLPISQANGWGYPQGMYYYWFCLGWRIKPFVSLTPPKPPEPSRVKGRGMPSEYARNKATALSSQDGRPNTFSALMALARYIDQVE